MQYVLVADPHLGWKNTNESFDLTFRLFKEICQTAQEREIQYFICLGDLFHSKSISFKMLGYLNNIKELLENTFNHSYLIVANHDIFYKNKIVPNGLAFFYHSPNITVVESPQQINDKITLFPWPTTENIEQIKKIDTSIVMGHFGINEMPLNRHGTRNTNEPLNIKDFKEFDLVLTGHYHEPSNYNNIKYLGSPYHTTFADSGDRGYYIFDDETESLEFIPFYAPKFVVIDANDEVAQEDIQDNHVRIDFCEQWAATEIEKKIKEVEDLGALSVKTRYSFTSVMEAEESSPTEISGNKEIIDAYLDNIEYPKGISDKLLKSIIDNLYQECKEE